MARLSQRNPAIDIARGLLVLAVVMLHVSQILNNTSSTAYRLDYWLTPVRMPALLFISGMLSSRARGIALLRLARLRQLGWLLLVWTIVMWLIFRLLHIPYALPMELLTPSNYLWYIWLLLLLSFTLPLWSSNAGLLLLVAGSASMANQSGWLNSQNLALNDLARLSWFFYLGLSLSRPLCDHLLRVPISAVIVVTALVLLLHVLVGNTAGLTLAISEWMQTHGMILLLLYACVGLARSPLRAILQSIGSKTLPVYLAHMPLLLLLGTVLPTSNNMLWVLLATPLISAACLVGEGLSRKVGAIWLWQAPKTLLPKAEKRQAFGTPVPISSAVS